MPRATKPRESVGRFIVELFGFRAHRVLGKRVKGFRV